MEIDPEAFAHVPHLRDKILSPFGSRFRALDYDVIDQQARDLGFPPDWRRSHEDRERTRVEALEGREGQDLWVFGYGSLMWDPAFIFREIRLARTPAHKRSFCLRTEFGRGSTATPGLIAALDSGPGCEGLAFRIAAEDVTEETRIVWKREMIMTGYLARFIRVETELGELDALTFLIDPACGRYHPDTEPEVAAKMIATGHGTLGSNLEYLDSLATQLGVLGLSDPEFDRLHGLARQFHTEAAE